MDKVEIANELLSFVRKTIIDSSVEIGAETPFKDLGIDSVSIINIVLFIERKFDLALPEEALSPENLRSIHSLANCTFELLEKE